MNKLNWPYANLSMNAKKAGGPVQYLSCVFNQGRDFERRTVPAKVITGGIIGIALGICIEKTIQHYRE